ncbi:ATP-binding protein [Phenylobacterium sp.]|uniref:hybrid sensor histidine kinase/response regulator n=1 Tax=Phenylobacterium sp. TaxID=1871053 RepID=UPI0035AF4C7D
MKTAPVGGAAPRRDLGFNLLAPLAVVAVGAMVVFVLSLVLWSREVDAGARMREESLVRQGVIARIGEIERSIFPQTNWDEAVVRLDNRFDRAWARDNLAAFLTQAGGFDTVFVVDGQGRPLYASRRGEDAPLALYDDYRGAGALIADVREAEQRRGPVAVPAAGARKMLTRPIQSSGLVIVGGEPQLVTASLVQTDFGHARPKGPRAPVVLTAAPLDAALLAPIGERYQLNALKAVIDRPQVPRGDLATAGFHTLRGGPSVTLVWTPRRPGAELLRAAIGPVILVIVAFAAVGGLMVVRARRAAEGLIASNRAQSEFLANMSHEIRTPLNGVVAIAAALEKTGLSDRQAELVRIIRGSGQTLERLLSDVLDLSKIETGAVVIEREPFHLGEAVRAVGALCRPRADEKGVALVVEVAPAAERLVLGDVVRVKQVITNLVSNAVKFTETGRVVLRVLAGRGETSWRIEVEDTGVGFDPADKAKIFGRFQQADGSVTRRYGGTGLGLSISRQLVELMGGDLDCDSTPGAGSIFIVDLPLPPAAEAATPAPLFAADRLEAPGALASRPAANGPAFPAPGADLLDDDVAERRLRVLLADDHPTNRTVVEVLLTGLDLDLVSVENGLEACEAFEADRFDVVLMDMQMPVMDGLNAVRRLRTYERRQRLSPSLVVMLTANAMREHHDLSLAAGADLHLAKPIEAARLFAALEAGMARTAAAVAAAI